MPHIGRPAQSRRDQGLHRREHPHGGTLLLCASHAAPSVINTRVFGRQLGKRKGVIDRRTADAVRLETVAAEKAVAATAAHAAALVAGPEGAAQAQAAARAADAVAAAAAKAATEARRVVDSRKKQYDGLVKRNERLVAEAAAAGGAGGAGSF